MAINIRRNVTGGTKQYNVLSFHGYQSSDERLSGVVYTDNFSGVGQGALATIGTATISERRTGRPRVGDLFQRVYDPSNFATQRPLVGRVRNYVRVVTTAINSGVSVVVSWDLTNSNWISIVVRNNGVSQAMKCLIQSAAGQSEEFSFTTGSTSDWQQFRFQKGTGTLVGNINYAAVNLCRVTADLTASTFDFACGAHANEEINLVGSVINLNLDSVETFERKWSVEQAGIMIKQMEKQSIATKKAHDLTLGFKESDQLLEAAAYGSSINTGNQTVENLLGTYTVPSNGVVTLPTGLTIARVVSGATALQESRLATNVDGGYYNYAGTSLTVNASEMAGQTVEVWIYQTRAVDFIADDGLPLGWVGYLEAQSQAENGSIKTALFKRCQITGSDQTFAAEGDMLSLKAKALPFGSRNRTFEMFIS